MMQCFIYSHDELIGEATFVILDSGMGVTSAPFCPGQSYENISTLVREFSLLGFSADAETAQEKELHTQEVLRRLEALQLKAQTVAGEDLKLAGGVSITDFSEELDDDPYEVTLLGLPRSICEKYFND